MKNNQPSNQNTDSMSPQIIKKGMSTATAIIIVGIIIALAIIFTSKTRTVRDIDVKDLDKLNNIQVLEDEAGTDISVGTPLEEYTILPIQNTWKKITRGGYSFEMPSDWSESSLDSNGCDWFNISNETSDGMRMAGEVGIYPVSCFTLADANGYKENTMVNGYYILAFYDEKSGTTSQEIKETQEVYQRIVATFTK